MSTPHLPTDTTALVQTLQSHGVTDAYVFGSFARGDAQPDSDLDLLVTYRPGTTLFDIADLQRDLEQQLHRRVDLVSKRHLSKRLAARIQKDIKPLLAVV